MIDIYQRALSLSLYYEKLPDTIMKVEISQYLLTAHWRHWKVGGVIQSESEDLRIRKTPDINLSPRAGEDEMKYLNSHQQVGSKKG